MIFFFHLALNILKFNKILLNYISLNEKSRQKLINSLYNLNASIIIIKICNVLIVNHHYLRIWTFYRTWKIFWWSYSIKKNFCWKRNIIQKIWFLYSTSNKFRWYILKIKNQWTIREKNLKPSSLIILKYKKKLY